MEANWMRQRCEGIVRSMTLCNRFQSYKNEIQIRVELIAETKPIYQGTISQAFSKLQALNF